MKHIIKTQRIEFVTDANAEAFDLQHRVSAIFYSSLLPQIEKVFDEISSPDQIIQFDSLEIDLGTIPIRDIQKTSFPTEYTQKLYKTLTEVLRTHLISKKRQPLHYSEGMQWLFYMQKGYLPWNSVALDKDWEIEVLKAFASDYQMIQSLKALLRKNPVALKRIVSRHSEEFLVRLAAVMTANSQTDLLILINTLAEINGVIAGLKTIKRKKVFYWESTMHFMAMTDDSRDTAHIVRNALFNHIQESQKTAFHFKLFKDRLLKKYVSELPLTHSEIHIKPTPTAADTAKIPQPMPEEGIFVSLAGAVLLHPFLKMLFKLLGFTDNNQFKDPGSQGMALMTLQYLVSGGQA
ncbi:MAG: hypothetical protein H7Y27_08480, partial [Gemmatimonadaceae bacterium]|nr:hypothetical protein [Chitinophagaceae bacterium]